MMEGGCKSFSIGGGHLKVVNVVDMWLLSIVLGCVRVKQLAKG